MRFDMTTKEGVKAYLKSKGPRFPRNPRSEAHKQGVPDSDQKMMQDRGLSQSQFSYRRP